MSGTLDTYVLLAVVLGAFFVPRAFGVTAVSFAGVLVHELFVFAVPMVALLSLLRRRPHLDGHSKAVAGIRATAWHLALPLVAGGVSLLLVTQFGEPNVQQEEFEATMLGRLGASATIHVLWSGHSELSMSTSDNARIGLGALQRVGEEPLVSWIPVAYLLAVAFALVLRSQSEAPWIRVMLVVSMLVPLLASLVASDYFRWVGLSSTLGLFALLVVDARAPTSARSWLLVLLVAFAIFAPFGAVPGRPLPLHAFVYEALVGN